MTRILVVSQAPAALQAVSRLALIDGAYQEWDCVAGENAARTAVQGRSIATALVDVDRGDPRQGLRLIRAIAEASPNTQVIAVGDTAGYALLRAAYDSGARGFVEPDCSASELLSAIQYAAGGDSSTATTGGTSGSDRGGRAVARVRWRQRDDGEVQWRWNDLALFIPLWLGASNGFWGLVQEGSARLPSSLHFAKTSSTALLLFQATDDATAILVVLLLVVWRRRGRIGDLGWRRPEAKWLALALPISAGMVALASVLTAVSGTVFTNPTATQCSSLHAHSSSGTVVAVVLAVSIAAPLGEETVFRGFLYGWLRHRVPRWVAVVVSTLAFAAVHQIPGIFLPLAGVGVVLAIVYEVSGNIWPGVAVHGLFNLINVIPLLTSPC